MNLFSNFITPSDIRLLKDIVLSYGIDTMIFPDYSDTLDGGNWSVYHRIPPGGTSLSALRHSAMALLSIELGYILNSGVSNSRIRRRAVQSQSAGEYLRDTFDVVCRRVGLPIGIEESDRFFDLLSEVSGRPMPLRYTSERSRLVDLYIDGHKYVSMKRVVIYGEEDLVIALASFAVEVGLIPVLCASGGESGRLEVELRRLLGDRYPADMIVSEGMSFDALEAAIYKHSLCPDLMLGNSKGYYISRSLGIPLIRVGFPIHDRIGASHQSILCYSGTSYLLESIINALITARQSSAKIDYKYM
jgi:nitrogenase molybdenum-iron protein NifN